MVNVYLVEIDKKEILLRLSLIQKSYFILVYELVQAGPDSGSLHSSGLEGTGQVSGLSTLRI